MNHDNELLEKTPEEEKKSFFRSIYYGLLFVSILWLIKFLEVLFNIELKYFGVYPQTLKGLPGIIFSPLIHGDFSHLISNSMPLLILITMLFYFYRKIGVKILIFTWLIGNIWLWIMGREAYHIGASGIIYGLAAFLFVSGIIRKHPRLISISLLVAFLYGGMVWGILPIKEGVSWEGHITGMFAGILLATFYKKEGPQRKIYEWELEEDDEEDKLYGDKTIEEWDAYFDEKAKNREQKEKD